MLFDGPARKAEEGYGKHDDGDDGDDDDDIKHLVVDDDDHLCLSAVRLTGPIGRTLTASLSGCSGTCRQLSSAS